LYIDGVFSGGGIKGFALIGAFKAIEEKGLKFKRLAGTSAGSLLAAFITAGYTSSEIIELMDEINVKQFLDKRKTVIPFPFSNWLLLYWKLGLYKGYVLEKWIEEKLAKKGVKTFADLPHQALRLVASDLTNGKIIVLPDDLRRYGIEPSSFSVAKAVRMSCSLPYFFDPIKLGINDNNCIIVDGAVLSNFPIWLFEGEKKIRPLLGIKLSTSYAEKPANKINNAIQLFTALFETMKDAHDARYVSRRHEKNIIFIPLEGELTTEFDLTEEKKQSIIEIGEQRAMEFLKKWTY
jgi:NTE family protein